MSIWKRVLYAAGAAGAAGSMGLVPTARVGTELGASRPARSGVGMGIKSRQISDRSVSTHSPCAYDERKHLQAAGCIAHDGKDTDQSDIELASLGNVP